MIEKMEKLHIYCLRNQTSDIMEELLKAGVVQTERTQSMLPEDTARVLQPGEGLDLSREETLDVYKRQWEARSTRLHMFSEQPQ